MLTVDATTGFAIGSLPILNWPTKGVLVLGIARPDGDYLGAPRGAAQLAAGDTVLLYGPREKR